MMKIIHNCHKICPMLNWGTKPKSIAPLLQPKTATAHETEVYRNCQKFRQGL